MVRITIEELGPDGWQVKQKTTRLEEIKQALNLSGLAKLLNMTRGQFRYKYEK